MKNKKIFRSLILLILSFISFYLLNTYAMNFNSGSYKYDFYVQTIARLMRPVPIFVIVYLLYIILKPLIKEPLKKYYPLICIIITLISIFFLVINFF